MSFVLDPSRFSFMSHDPMTVTVTCDVTLTLNSKFQNKIKEKENSYLWIGTDDIRTQDAILSEI